MLLPRKPHVRPQSLPSLFRLLLFRQMVCCVLSFICPAFIHPDLCFIQAETEGVADCTRGLCPLCHLLLRGRAALRQSAAYPAFFLGASHRSSVFSGALYGIPSAAPRAGTRAFPDASGTGLLRGRRHGRRNFKLMKKKGMQQS